MRDLTTDVLRGVRLGNARFADDTLFLVFEDGRQYSIRDARQHCCENRYAVCDDDLSSVTGRKIVLCETRGVDGPGQGGEKHEIEFFVLQLDDGSAITLATHNEHNGYYGGFNVVVNAVTDTAEA
jgi:hypothetical protein